MNAHDVSTMLGQWLKENYPDHHISAPRFYDDGSKMEMYASVWSKSSDNDVGELVQLIPDSLNPQLVNLHVATWGITKRLSSPTRARVDLHHPDVFDVIRNYIDESFKACLDE